MADRADTDVTRLAAQIAAIASAPGGQQAQLKDQLAIVAASLGALGKALEAPDEPGARSRIADEVDRTRTGVLSALAKAPVKDPGVGALVSTLELLGSWLRTPDAENTAAVEKLVAALRAVPGGEALWTDQAAEAKRKAELDADVQKSLDEIKAGMPKLKL
jgi:hypothetical protein